MADDTDQLDAETEELLAQLLAANFGAQGGEETGDGETTEEQPGDEGEEDGEEPGEETPEPAEEPAPAPEPAATAEAPGPFDTLTPEEKAQLLELRNLLTNNPDIAGTLKEAVQAKFQPEPDKTLPPEIDPEDTTSVKLWERIQEIKAERDADNARYESRDKEVSQARVNTEIAAAVDQFKVAHPNLSDEDINNIRTYTSANVNIGNVMANFPNDPVQGIVRSMEIGSMTDPLTRDKVLGVDAKALEAQAEKSRKQKLSALSGSTGSGPRTKPQTKKPGNWQEMTKQLTKELEELGGI